MTAERDWETATAGSNELTYEAAVAIGKSDLEWEWLDSDANDVVTLTEWQAGRSTENTFYTVKNDDSINDIAIADLTTYITDDTLNTWYDEN